MATNNNKSDQMPYQNKFIMDSLSYSIPFIQRAKDSREKNNM